VWFHSALSQAEYIRRLVVLRVIPVGVVAPSAVARATLNAGGTCLTSALYGRSRPTRRCSRPLRARDRWFLTDFARARGG